MSNAIQGMQDAGVQVIAYEAAILIEAYRVLT
jgi:hypothetical protein